MSDPQATSVRRTTETGRGEEILYVVLLLLLLPLFSLLHPLLTMRSPKLPNWEGSDTVYICLVCLR